MSEPAPCQVCLWGRARSLAARSDMNPANGPSAMATFVPGQGLDCTYRCLPLQESAEAYVEGRRLRRPASAVTASPRHAARRVGQPLYGSIIRGTGACQYLPCAPERPGLTAGGQNGRSAPRSGRRGVVAARLAPSAASAIPRRRAKEVETREWMGPESGEERVDRRLARWLTCCVPPMAGRPSGPKGRLRISRG